MPRGGKNANAAAVAISPLLRCVMKMLAAVSLAATLGAGSVSALTVTTTYTGSIDPANAFNIDGGVDIAGLFGPVGAVIAGHTFVAQFVTDWTLQGTTRQGERGVFSSIQGGGSAVQPTPTKAKITVDGVVVSISGFAESQSERHVLPYASLLDFSADDRSVLVLSTANPTQDFIGSYRPAYNFTHTLSGADVGNGGFRGCGTDPAVCTTLQLSILSVSSTSAVPEPDAWAMTLVGAIGIGGLLRRRQIQLSALM